MSGEAVARVGIPLNDDAALASALRGAGVEIGHVGGERFRLHVARHLLASDWLAAHDERVSAEAWDQGAHAGGLMEHQWDPIPNPYRIAASTSEPTP